MFRATISPLLSRRAPAFIEKRFTTILCVRKGGKVVSELLMSNLLSCHELF